MSGVGSLDVLDGMENDPEVERNGMKSAAEYSAAHWQHILDIVEKSSTDQPRNYLMEDEAMEDRLYKIFETNFGGSFGVDLYNTTWEELHGSDMLLAKWRNVMTPFEGVMLDGAASNMLTLLRANPLDDCTESSAVIVVPRLQFMMVEVARVRAGCYRADFHTRQLTLRIQRVINCLKDCIGEALADTFPSSGDSSASQIMVQLNLLSQITSERDDYAIPPEILRKTGAAKTVAALAKASPRFGIASTQATARSLLDLWKAGAQVLKLPPEHRAVAAKVARSAVALAGRINQHSVLPTRPALSNACLVDVAADESNPIRGRYLVSKRAVAAGETLFEEEPVCRAPFEALPPLGVRGWKRACCFHCCRAADDCEPSWALPCEQCGIKAFEFCSPACKRQFGAIHAMECPLLSTVIPPRNLQDPMPAVGSFKVLLVLRAAMRTMLDPEAVRGLLSLEHHRELFQQRRPDYYTETEAAARRIEGCMPGPHHAAFSVLLSQHGTITTTAALQQLFFVIDVNCFGIGPHAGGLFAGLAPMCNHSCIENVTHAFDEPCWKQEDDDDVTGVRSAGSACMSGVMRFRATTHIAAGEEIAFSYLPDLHQPTAVRQERLSTHKFFECSCARCVDPTELGRIPLLPLGAAWDELLAKADESSSAVERWNLRRQIAINTELLIPGPACHTTKGVAQEALAEAALTLLLKEPHRATDGLADATANALAAARRNYTVCNGEDSAPVRRVLQLEQRLATVHL